ncbi:MAG: hypothetical protein ACPGVO_16300 [Spirulinaceae cyanobacterium]
MSWQLEIQGESAPTATQELFQSDGLKGDWQTVGKDEREGVLTTIATIVAITGGTIAIAEKLYGWFKKNKAEKRIEKVLLVGKNGQRVLLKDATIEQIKAILES